jgi:hypothetical protein
VTGHAKGTLRRARRVIAGLLVLTVLLFSGAQASTLMLPIAHHHETNGAGQTIAAVTYGTATPVRDDDRDHGLPCCIGGQCVTHAYWMPAYAAGLAGLSKLGAALFRAALFRRTASPHSLCPRPPGRGLTDLGVKLHRR